MIVWLIEYCDMLIHTYTFLKYQHFFFAIRGLNWDTSGLHMFPDLVNVWFTYLWQHISLFQVEKWSSDFLSVLERWTFFSSFARGISAALGLLDTHDSSPGGQRRNLSCIYRSYLVELWVKAHKLFDPINAGWCTAIWSQAGVVVNRMGIFTVLLRVGPRRE